MLTSSSSRRGLILRPGRWVTGRRDGRSISTSDLPRRQPDFQGVVWRAGNIFVSGAGPMRLGPIHLLTTPGHRTGQPSTTGDGSSRRTEVQWVPNATAVPRECDTIATDTRAGMTRCCETMACMNTVLIAVDDSDDAVATATATHELFGDRTKYYLINVESAALRAWCGARHIRWSAQQRCTRRCGRARQLRRWPRPMLRRRAAPHRSLRKLPSRTRRRWVTPEIPRPPSCVRHTIIAADLVVVGHHEHSWLSRLFLRSLSDDIVKRADLPVLVIK